jgi:hypothetical protein
MSKLSLVAALLASLGLGVTASAGGPQPYADPYMHGGYCDACNECACGHHGLFGRHRRNMDAELGFNCGCNGSYKYPVPPLYTYHWPGMNSAQLMTDYHSPWRFPPLKPYTDEVIEVQTSLSSLRRVQPAAAAAETRTTQRASFAERVEQTLR